MAAETDVTPPEMVNDGMATKNQDATSLCFFPFSELSFPPPSVYWGV